MPFIVIFAYVKTDVLLAQVLALSKMEQCTVTTQAVCLGVCVCMRLYASYFWQSSDFKVVSFYRNNHLEIRSF